MSAATWFWIAVFSMAVGSLAFFVLGFSGRPEDRASYMTSFFITLIAGTMYLVLALGQGSTVVAGERVVFYARYVTWSVTTPLLLLSLASSGLGAGLGKHRPLLAGLIGADVYMIATGLLSELSGEPLNWIWYIVSSAAFVAVLVLIWGPLRQAVLQQGNQGPISLWNRLAVVLTALWLGYPLVWLLGPVGFGAISPVSQNALFVSLDILAKVGWGLLYLFGLRALPEEREPAVREKATVR